MDTEVGGQLRAEQAKESAMEIVLSPDVSDMIQRRLDGGTYGSADEVVRDALRLLEERDKLARLRAAIAVGDAQIARGEGIEWTPDAMERLKREAAVNVRRGKPIKDEVKP